VLRAALQQQRLRHSACPFIGRFDFRVCDATPGP
jgi:hypothetical protein